MAQVLREHRDTLVSVMETFVHDPLCEWTQRKHQRSSAEEMDNPQAKDALATLEGAHSIFSAQPSVCATPKKNTCCGAFFAEPSVCANPADVL